MDDDLKRLLDANSAETRRLFESSTERIEGRFAGVEERLTGLPLHDSEHHWRGRG